MNPNPSVPRLRPSARISIKFLLFTAAFAAGTALLAYQWNEAHRSRTHSTHDARSPPRKPIQQK